MNRYEVILIGGGVIGLSTGYRLLQEGYRIAIIEKDMIGNSASGYNAGYIVPTMYFPFNLCISLKSILKWITQRSSPVKVKLNVESFSWLLKAFKSRSKYLDETWIGFLNRALSSIKEFMDVCKSVDCDSSEFNKIRIYEVYGNEHELWSAKKSYEKIKFFKDHVKFLDVKEIQDIFKVKSSYIVGGFEHNGDYIVEPLKYIEALKTFLIRNGASIYEQTNIMDLKVEDDSIRIPSLNIEGKYLIITTGPWVNKFSKIIGFKLPIIPVAGYKGRIFNVNMKYPVFIEDTKIALTPYMDYLSIAGVFDIVGFIESVDKSRISHLLKRSSELIPELSKAKVSDIKVKFRPCSPDEIPIVDRSLKNPNVIFSSGHCRFGLTFSLYTANEILKMIIYDDYIPDYINLKRSYSKK